MHVLERERIDLDLASALVSAQSEFEAMIAFSLLRDTVPEPQLTMLVNLRELLLEMPAVPFRTAGDLNLLERTFGYEYTGRSYRRQFDSSDGGVFGLEFVGHDNTCEAILVHTPASRFSLSHNGDHELDAETLAVFARHEVLLDAAFEALGLLGWVLDPKIYLSVDDFVGEHAAAAGNGALDLF